MLRIDVVCSPVIPDDADQSRSCILVKSSLRDERGTPRIFCFIENQSSGVFRNRDYDAPYAYGQAPYGYGYAPRYGYGPQRIW